MRPTKEQIAYYIQCADLEMGPGCADEWVEQVRTKLREWAVDLPSACANGHDWIEDNTFRLGRHERCSRQGCGIVRGKSGQ